MSISVFASACLLLPRIIGGQHMEERTTPRPDVAVPPRPSVLKDTPPSAPQRPGSRHTHEPSAPRSKGLANTSRSAVIRGQVSGLQQRLEHWAVRPVTVWDFRVERHDDAGNPLPRIHVEMRGRSFEGSIANGDWVEITANRKNGKVLHTRNVRNLTAGVIVTTRGQTVARTEATLRLVMLLIIVVVVSGLLLLWRNPEIGPSFSQQHQPTVIKVTPSFK